MRNMEDREALYDLGRLRTSRPKSKTPEQRMKDRIKAAVKDNVRSGKYWGSDYVYTEGYDKANDAVFKAIQESIEDFPTFNAFQKAVKELSND